MKPCGAFQSRIVTLCELANSRDGFGPQLRRLSEHANFTDSLHIWHASIERLDELPEGGDDHAGVWRGCHSHASHGRPALAGDSLTRRSVRGRVSAGMGTNLSIGVGSSR